MRRLLQIPDLMLLTCLSFTNLDEAMEKVRWYCLQWRIEVFHKILISGLCVERVI